MLRVLILSLSVITLLTPFCPSSPAARSAWLLQQRSTSAGSQVCLIAPDAIKLTTKSINVVMRAPKYDALIYNDANKRFVELSYEKWRSRYKRNPKVGVPDCVKDLKSEKVAGWATEHYTRPIWHRPGMHEEYWVSKELAPAGKFSDLVLTAMRLPTGLGMPLRVAQYKGNTLHVISVDTTKCSKVKVTDKDFECPKGYKRADTDIEVLFDAESEGASDLLLKLSK